MAEWWIWLSSERERVLWARVCVKYCGTASWLNGGHGWALRERVLWATVCVEYCRAAWWLNGGHGWALREGMLWARVNVEYCRTASWLSGGHGWAEREWLISWTLLGYLGQIWVSQINPSLWHFPNVTILWKFLMEIWNGCYDWFQIFLPSQILLQKMVEWWFWTKKITSQNFKTQETVRDKLTWSKSLIYRQQDAGFCYISL